MRLADYALAFLKDRGIDTVFTVCGGGAIFLCDALAKSGMRYVACHHEQAAAMAAEAYARTRTNLGLAIVTSGPGGTNAVTGVAGAWTDHVPTITLSGQVFSSQMVNGRGLRTLGVQEINIVDMVRPITKYAAVVKDPWSIRYELEKAVYLAREGRPGPVWLDLPADVQNAEIDPEQLQGFMGQVPRGSFPDEWAREEAATVIDLLRHAKRPMLHIGQGIRLAHAIPEMYAFLDLARMPVVTARNGADIIESSHDLYIGRPGTFAQRGANFAVQTCDLYIAIGTRLSLAQTGYNAKDYARNAYKVMIDIDQAELSKDTVSIDLPIQADAREFLRALCDAAKGAAFPDWSEWLGRCKAWQAQYPPVTEDQRTQAKYVNSYHLIERLSNVCTEGDVIVTDMGFSFQNTHQAWSVKLGQRLMTNCGLAAMGWGLPSAIGAATASGGRVICIVGDGGLMMNVQELATIAHHRRPIKVFCLNNGGYLTMRQSQSHAFDGYMGSDEGSGISFPDFETVVAAHGIRYDRMESSREVDEVISRAFASDGPHFVEVMMDPEQAQIPKSVNRRENGKIVQTPIEDAWPYLDRSELAENLRV